MGNLANSYSDLGRHADALAMQERVVEFYRRVLPENHPSIGEGRVGSGAHSFSVFAGCVTFLSPSPAPFSFSSDLFSALACYNISFSLERTGALPRALEAAREALRTWQATLPPGHEDISDAEERVRKLEQATR